MADYGSSGIWGFSDKPNGAFRHTMYEYSDLNLPKELRDGFAKWIEIYEEHNLNNTLDTEAFNIKGKELATQLKLYFGNKRHIEFQGEAKDDDLLDLVIIN